jgi:hypothetical protein
LTFPPWEGAPMMPMAHWRQTVFKVSTSECLFLARGLAEPVVEARRADAWVVAWDERSIVQFQAEIGRVRISDHFARVVRRFQKSPDELAERRPLGTGDLESPC